MKLIIVESPTKAKTINKFLGKDFVVESSYGHVRDLPKSDLGIDVEKNFEPKYIIPVAAKKNVTKLKKLAEKADEIILATDEDREGEAIAWHLLEALNIKNKESKRIAFHEITKDAIEEALKNPRKLDLKLVDAQQARRVLDRLVGYELSPFLWKKVARGLSAGRVQSVAVRLVIEREREIKAFKPEEYWDISAKLDTEKKEELEAKLHKIGDESLDKKPITNKADADKILSEIKGKDFEVAGVESKQNKKNPPAPFTTSTLQQAANRMLGFSAKQTMMIAQQLYEGIDMPGEGHVGLITYMRTDSFNLSGKFLSDAKDYIEKNFSEEYRLKSPRVFKTKSKNAQEAHEAIRPTEAYRDPESLKSSLNPNQHKLYKLIWQRAIASQMPEALVNSTTIDILVKETNYNFRSTGQTLTFEGYLKVYPEKTSDIILPQTTKGEKLEVKEVLGQQHFTKPPARYSDAGLVKKLEEYEIGRPSTYAPTIATITSRNYVERDENKRLKPTDIAFVVNDLMVNHFPNIVDFKFTADMENKLDDIAAGEKEWQPVISEFYKPFHANLQEKYEQLDRKDIMPEEKSDEKCDKCGAPMIIKTGRYGKFLACSAFPECKNIKALDKNKDGVIDEKDKKIGEQVEKLKEKYAGQKCDKCGSDMIIRTGRFGPFLACSAYPKCRNIKNIEENNNSTGIKCPKCDKGEIVQKRSRRGSFYACSNYPDCKNSYPGKPTGDKCPKCDSLMIEDKDENVRCSNKKCQ